MLRAISLSDTRGRRADCSVQHCRDFVTLAIYLSFVSKFCLWSPLLASEIHDLTSTKLDRFLTEVDNLSYHFGIGEKARERVEEAGHVELTDTETRRLTRTKSLCGILIFGGIMIAIVGRVAWGAIMTSAVIAVLCKASELLSREDWSTRQKLQFLGGCTLFQVVGGSVFLAVTEEY